MSLLEIFNYQQESPEHTEKIDEWANNYQEIVSYMAAKGELNHLGDQRLREKSFRDTKKAWKNLENQYKQLAQKEKNIHSIRDSVDFEDDGEVYVGAFLTGNQAADKADIKPEETMSEIAELEYENRIRTSGSDAQFVISLYKNLGSIKEEYEGTSNSMQERRENHYQIWDSIVQGLEGKDIETDILKEKREEIEQQRMISCPRGGNYGSKNNAYL